MGNRKAAVLPEPVRAITTRSAPVIAAGRALRCTGVGTLYPRFSTALSSSFGRPKLWNDDPALKEEDEEGEEDEDEDDEGDDHKELLLLLLLLLCILFLPGVPTVWARRIWGQGQGWYSIVFTTDL
jgi:hypothetical protein